MSDIGLSKASSELEADGRGVLPETSSKYLPLFYMIRGEMFRESAYDALVTTGSTEITNQEVVFSRKDKKSTCQEIRVHCLERVEEEKAAFVLKGVWSESKENMFSRIVLYT